MSAVCEALPVLAEGQPCPPCAPYVWDTPGGRRRHLVTGGRAAVGASTRTGGSRISAPTTPRCGRRPRTACGAAGDRVLPALRAAPKVPTPTSCCAPTVLVSRLEWGIYPETPAAVVAEIERYRGGDEAQKPAAVTQLTREGGAGFKVLRRLLLKETNDDRKRAIADQLKTLIRPQVRDLIARGEFDDAECMLEMASLGGVEATLDYCTFLVLSVRWPRRRELETKSDDKASAVLGAYLRRAMGDLGAARKLAEKSGDEALLSRCWRSRRTSRPWPSRRRPI